MEASGEWRLGGVRRENVGVLTLAAVVAHPDDDAYGIAGTVALHAADEGFRFVLVHATDGEAGDIRPGFPATRKTLGQVRRAEDGAGLVGLGRPPDRHVWLGYRTAKWTRCVRRGRGNAVTGGRSERGAVDAATAAGGGSTLEA